MHRDQNRSYYVTDHYGDEHVESGPFPSLFRTEQKRKQSKEEQEWVGYGHLAGW